MLLLPVSSHRRAHCRFHDHTLDITTDHVYKGLAGFYLIEPKWVPEAHYPCHYHCHYPLSPFVCLFTTRPA